MRLADRELVMFAGCDYLGLAHDARVIEALRIGAEEFGLSSSGSRETTGNTVAHDELESELARFLGVEAVLLVPDGYLSNLAFAQGLPESCAHVLVDKECHVSVRDAITATGRRPIEYAFVQATDAAARANELGGQGFSIFTDGIFPVMRGLAPLPELLALLGEDGSLVVDDCHGLGVLGVRGRGTIEHFGLRDPRLVITGTLSKALGCFGGFVAGTRELVERTRARSHAYVGSTPIPPAIARAAATALRVLEAEPDRRTALRTHVERVRGVVRDLGHPVHPVPFPVFAIQLADHATMARAHHELRDRGLLVPYVHYPDSLGGYFRLALSAVHTEEQVDELCAGLRGVLG